MNPFARATFAVLKAYSRITPTERGGFRLARFARRTLPREQWKGTFTTPGPMRFELDLGTYPDVCMAFGLYERDTERVIRKTLRPGMHFVDVGANIGYFTVLAAKLVGPTGRVDAFEPDPINRARLVKHLEENGVVDRVRVHAVGLGAEAGKVTLYHPKGVENHGSASIFQSAVGEGEAFSIEIARADEVLERVPDLIKMDIEGAELLAIRGMTGLLTGERPPAMIIEHNHETARAGGHSMADIFRTLREAQSRYNVYWIGTRLKRFATPDALESMSRQGNILVTVD